MAGENSAPVKLPVLSSLFWLIKPAEAKPEKSIFVCECWFFSTLPASEATFIRSLSNSSWDTSLAGLGLIKKMYYRLKGVKTKVLTALLRSIVSRGAIDNLNKKKAFKVIFASR